MSPESTSPLPPFACPEEPLQLTVVRFPSETTVAAPFRSTDAPNASASAAGVEISWAQASARRENSLGCGVRSTSHFFLREDLFQPAPAVFRQAVQRVRVQDQPPRIAGEQVRDPFEHPFADLRSHADRDRIGVEQLFEIFLRERNPAPVRYGRKQHFGQFQGIEGQNGFGQKQAGIAAAAPKRRRRREIRRTRISFAARDDRRPSVTPLMAVPAAGRQNARDPPPDR